MFDRSLFFTPNSSRLYGGVFAGIPTIFESLRHTFRLVHQEKKTNKLLSTKRDLMAKLEMETKISFSVFYFMALSYYFSGGITQEIAF